MEPTIVDSSFACYRESSNETTPRRNRKDGSEYRLVKNRRSPQVPASMPGKIRKLNAN